MATDPRTVKRGLVVASFLPWLVRVADYATLGSFLPLLILSPFSLAVGWGLSKGGRPEALAVKAWGAFLILWAIARLGMMTLLLFLPVAEAHILAQLTLGYVIWSLMNLALGIFFWRI